MSAAITKSGANSFSAITTTKLRVLASASADGYSRIVERRLGLVHRRRHVYDLALGATAMASTSYPGWGSSAVVNGDRKSLNAYNNGAWSSSAANNFPKRVQVDFSTNRTINEIHVFTLQDSWAAPTEPTPAMTFTRQNSPSYRSTSVKQRSTLTRVESFITTMMRRV